MTSRLRKMAALLSLTVLAACNTTSSAPTVGTFPPSPEASNPKLEPDGTVRRLVVSR